MINMTEDNFQPPRHYQAILEATREKGFTMPSDRATCGLLRILAASKPGGRLLEMGTGTGLATSWILDGMDPKASLVTFDNDQSFLKIAKKFLGADKRLEVIHVDGEEWVLTNKGQHFDFIFADTWHGKYLLLEETLKMLRKGGIYIIDDMLPQPNWPEGHAEKAIDLVKALEDNPDLWISKLHWSTGIIIAVKK